MVLEAFIAARIAAKWENQPQFQAASKKRKKKKKKN
jgi:hypothetical protein